MESAIEDLIPIGENNSINRVGDGSKLNRTKCQINSQAKLYMSKIKISSSLSKS